MVAYDIPNRDCGGNSSGGATDPAAYRSWIGQFAQGLGQDKAWIILEPDALALTSCLSPPGMQTRLELLSYAVTTLKQDRNAKVYIDAGHSNWVAAGTMAGNLQKAGIDHADGFATNVSNFIATAAEAAYGEQVSAKAGNKHFVIDTSRNGNGSNGEWCNPLGRAIGEKPTTQTGNKLVDAFLWIKIPGQSDGNSGECHGSNFPAGTWWPDYALALVRNAH
jgi:endoglucanase